MHSSKSHGYILKPSPFFASLPLWSFGPQSFTHLLTKMETQFNFFGDIQAAISLLEQARKKMKLQWENQTSCMSMDDIEKIENLIRLIRGEASEIKDLKDKHKTIALIRAAGSKD